MLYSRIAAQTSTITKDSACETRMRSPNSVQSNRYRLSVRSPSIQKRPVPYQMK